MDGTKSKINHLSYNLRCWGVNIAKKENEVAALYEPLFDIEETEDERNLRLLKNFATKMRRYKKIIIENAVEFEAFEMNDFLFDEINNGNVFACRKVSDEFGTSYVVGLLSPEQILARHGPSLQTSPGEGY